MKLPLVVASTLVLFVSPITARDGRWDAGATWLSGTPLAIPAAFGGTGNGNGDGNGNTGSGNGNGNGNGNSGSGNGNGNGNNNSGSDNGNRNGNDNAGSGFGNGVGNGLAGSGLGNDTGNGAGAIVPGHAYLTSDYSRADSWSMPSAYEGAKAPWEALWLEMMGGSILPPPVQTPPDEPVNSLY